VKLTQDELDQFPLQAGIRGGSYFEINLVEDGHRLIITCDSIEAIPHEYLRYGGHIYRFESVDSTLVDYDMPGIDLCYKAT
jgi:hypothetical protein